MRYMTVNKGYEKRQAKDNLICMYERLARSMMYKLDYFNRDMSSLLAMILIDINGHLSENRKLLDLPEEESRKFVLKTIDEVWKHDGGTKDRAMNMLKQQFQTAMLQMIPEGYAARAKFFIESIIDTTMKMVDPFEGMFHNEKLEIPDEIRKIFKMPPKGQEYVKKEWPKVYCKGCGGEMKWIQSLHKHVCTDSTCIEYVDVPPPPR